MKIKKGLLLLLISDQDIWTDVPTVNEGGKGGRGKWRGQRREGGGNEVRGFSA